MRTLAVSVLLSMMAMCLFCNNALAEKGYAQMEIVDESGNAISNIHVLITDEGGGVVFEDRTGSHGTITWSSSQIPDGRYIIYINYGDNERNYNYEAQKRSANLKTSYPRWTYYDVTLAKE